MYQREPERYEEFDVYRERPGDLHKLKKLDNWQIAEEDPDIRGWDVYDRDGNRIAKVDDLIIDSNSGRAIFAEVGYGGTMGVGETKTLIPLEECDLDKDNNRVNFMGTEDQIKNAPHYAEDQTNFSEFYDYWSGITTTAAAPRHEEREVTETTVEGERRVIPEVEEHVEARKREYEVGEVEVHKEVERAREHVSEPVKRTRIRVLRRDVAPREAAAGEQVLREGETLEIPVVEEHLETTKRAEVTGEVVIQPETYEEEEEVTEEVRKEHVEVETHGEAELEEEEEEERTRHRP